MQAKTQRSLKTLKLVTYATFVQQLATIKFLLAESSRYLARYTVYNLCHARNSRKTKWAIDDFRSTDFDECRVSLNSEMTFEIFLDTIGSSTNRSAKEFLSHYEERNIVLQFPTQISSHKKVAHFQL